MIVVGEPGSGKTHFVLKQVEAALRERRAARVLLVTPTSSMARHLTHELARRGLAVPGDVITPIRPLVERLTPELKQPSAVVDSWLLEEAMAHSGSAVFGNLSRSPGLLRRAKTAIEELQAAGCSPEQAKTLAETSEQRALAASYGTYQGFLDTYEFVSAPQRRIAAAQAAALNGLPGKEELYFDGFWDYSPVERDLIRSLQNRGLKIVVTTTPQASRHFKSWPREELGASHRKTPRRVVIAAPGLDQEVEEIARRILAADRPWREIGVLLRSPEQYAATIEAVFTRFGIPYRLQRAQALREHPAAAFVTELLSCIAEDFPGESLLQALRRPAFRLSQDPQFDRFDFDLQEKLPAKSLEFLLRDAPVVVQEALACLAETSTWRQQKAAPQQWPQRIKELRRQLLAQPTATDRLTALEVIELRTWARAIAAIDLALDEAAGLLEFRGRMECRFAEFLAALERALDNAELAVADERRDVVNVLSVHEARQWELPVVFVCGMVEGGFPAELADDLFFPELERRRLAPLGVSLRSRTDRVAGERLLFEIAESRASEELILSYPEGDGARSPLLRSFFLTGDAANDLKAGPVRPQEQPSDGPTPDRGKLSRPAELEALRAKHVQFSPSRLELFLQCPYAFFANYSLRLRERPGKLEERLDAREGGTIIHATLERWGADQTRPISDVLSEVFAETLEKLHVRRGFRTAVLEETLRQDLERFVQENLFEPLPGAQAGGFEQPVGYIMEEGLDGEIWINGKVDRYDTLGDGRALVIDYKHSAPDRIKKLIAGHQEGKKLQGPLYLAGLKKKLDLEPAGMLFCSLKGETTFGGWVCVGAFPDAALPKGVEAVSAEELDRIVGRGVQAAAAAGSRIRGGEIAVEPDDRDYCKKFCSFQSVCRIEL